MGFELTSYRHAINLRMKFIAKFIVYIACYISSSFSIT